MLVVKHAVALCAGVLPVALQACTLTPSPGELARQKAIVPSVPSGKGSSITGRVKVAF